MLAGKYNKLRFFQFGGMNAPSVGHQKQPTYIQQEGAMSYTAYGGQRRHTWFNATFSALRPGLHCPESGGRLGLPPPAKE